jgi:hypothetical protein
LKRKVAILVTGVEYDWDAMATAATARIIVEVRVDGRGIEVDGGGCGIITDEADVGARGRFSSMGSSREENRCSGVAQLNTLCKRGA